MSSEPRTRSAAVASSVQDQVFWGQVFWRVALTNLPFVLVLAFGGQLPDLAQAVVIGLVLFIVPGSAWVDRGIGDAVTVLFRIVAASLVIALATWLAFLLLPWPTHRISFVLVLALITNAGLWIGQRRNWFAHNPFDFPLVRALGIVAALFYLQSFAGAVYFVPPLDDQDMETQGTAYGLIHEAEPTMVTDRGRRFFFSHPLLLHFWIGESALLSDDLDRLRPYHERSLEAKAAPERIPQIAPAEIARFFSEPLLLPTRTPNIFLAALTMLPLGLLIYRLSGSQVAAIGSCVLYATLPEIYVRSSYGGYLALTNFLLVVGTYLYLQASSLLPERDMPLRMSQPTSRNFAFVAAFMAGWADQKSILLPFAAPAHAALRVLFEGRLAELPRRLLTRPYVLTAFLVGVGFLGGWLSYALYGLSVAPTEWVDEFLRAHVVQRLKMNDVTFAAPTPTGWAYPSVVGLWQQFGNHCGWLFIAVGGCGVIHALRRFKEAHGMIALWVLIGAIGFSIVDWRQTKHLAHILPAITILIGVFWASRQGRARTVLGVVLCGAILWNVWRISRLMLDFEYLRPTPIW